VSPTTAAVLDTPVSLASLADDIMTAHRAALGASRTALENARRAGELLRQAKRQLGHGEWHPWLAANCDISIRMTQVYMQIAKGWPAIVEKQNAYPDTHFDITTARQILANPHWTPDLDSNDDEPHEDDDAPSEDELGPGGCDGSGHGSDGTGGSSDTGTKTLWLVLSVIALEKLRQQLKELARYFGVDADNETDRICAVVDHAHTAVLRQEERG